MHPFSRRRATLADFAKAVVLALAYLWLARLGLRMHAISSFATLVWPPTGLALASMLLWGFRFFPAITLAAFVANLWTGAPPLVALGIAAGNTLEAVAGAYALRRIPGFRCSLDRLKDVVGLIALAAVGASTISATIGVASLAAGGLVRPELLGTTWFAWWLGDAIAAMIVAPLLLTLRVDRGAPVRPSRVPEAAAVTLLLAAASLYLFEFTTGGVAVTLSPLLVWAAVRFEQKGAACSVFLVSVVAIWATARGHGPFARESVEASLFTVQTFLALTTATFLVLGATTAERRRAEEELRRAKNEAEAANRAKDQFLATLSHELRTPLTPVLAFASSLEKRTELSPDVRRQVQIVRRNAELEARLIDDMLDLTRIAKGKLQIEPEPVFVRDAVEHVPEICRDDAAAKGVVLEREEETGEALVHADPARLRQVIWNLVKNSIKFTPPGGRIRVRLFSPTAASIAIEVTDTGAGFDESNASRLFQPFEQAGERTDGLGLGSRSRRASSKLTAVP